MNAEAIFDTDYPGGMIFGFHWAGTGYTDLKG